MDLTSSISSNLVSHIFLFLMIMILALGLSVFIGYFVVYWMRYHKREARSLSLVCLLVSLPKNNEIKIEAAEQMFAGMYGIIKRGLSGFFQSQESISFEIAAKPSDIRFYVLVPDYLRDLVEKQIHSTYSEAEIIETEEYNIFHKEGKVAFASLKFSNANIFPIKRFKDLPTDPLNLVTSAMSKLSEEESAVLQIIVSPAGNQWRGKGKTYVASIREHQTQGELAQVNADTSLTQGVEEKIAKVGFNTLIRIVCVGKTEENAKATLNNIVNAFEQFRLASYNGFLKRSSFLKKFFLIDFLYRYFSFFTRPMILNTDELATIFHFPNKEVLTPHIHSLLAKKSAPPTLLPETGLYLGESVFRGLKKKVHIMVDDRRRHMYIVGQTGVGKSEFLKSMIIQDIKEGKGVAFLDPHGDAVEDILTKIPPERAEDVVYFDPGDTERPMGLNILEAETEEQKHLVINSFIGLLYKLYDPNHTGIMGPRLERAIRNVMLTAMEEKGNTLVEVLRLLISPEFAKEKMAIIKDPLVKRYWTEELAQTSDFHKSETLGYFVSKFDRFVTDKLMRNIIGQSPSAFNFRKVMDERKILLCNLSKGKIGDENSQFLGLILVPRILVAAMSRVNIPEDQRADFYLYVDEFQNFATPDFAQILSEARKYRLSLCVANQFIAQMEEHIRNAVFGNVGTLVSFRVGVDDAEYLFNHFEPTFDKHDLMNVAVGNVYLRLLINGAPSTPFSLAVDWEMISKTPKNPEVGEMIRQLSRLKYGRDKDVVEAEIRLRAKLE